MEFDYASLLGESQKRQLLLDAFENQTNKVKYFLEDDLYDYAEKTAFMEKLVTNMGAFLEENLPRKAAQ